MKAFKLMMVATGMVAALLVCCKKDDPDPHTLNGFWKGKYGIENTYPGSGYAFLIRADGTIRVFSSAADTNNAFKAEGIYSFLGSRITAQYTYSTKEIYSISATVNEKFTFMEGTWGDGDKTSGKGNFFLVKE